MDDKNDKKANTVQVQNLVKVIRDYTDDPAKWNKDLIPTLICINPESGEIYTVSPLSRQHLRTVLAVALANEMQGEPDYSGHINKDGEFVEGPPPGDVAITGLGSSEGDKPS